MNLFGVEFRTDGGCYGHGGTKNAHDYSLRLILSLQEIQDINSALSTLILSYPYTIMKGLIGPINEKNPVSIYAERCRCDPLIPGIYDLGNSIFLSARTLRSRNFYFWLTNRIGSSHKNR